MGYILILFKLLSVFIFKCGLEMGTMDRPGIESRPNCLFDPFPKQRKQMKFSILLTLLVSLVSVQATPLDFASLYDDNESEE